MFGNEFGMSFSVVRGAAQLSGQGIAFLGNVFCGGANVPSSNAALFDNEGLPPLARPRRARVPVMSYNGAWLARPPGAALSI